MAVIWLNAPVGAGKSAVGRALAALLPAAAFMDGDDYAGPAHLSARMGWHIATQALLAAAARPGGCTTLVIAYPLDRLDYRRLRAVCGRAHRSLVVVNLATPLPMILRGRGGRQLDAAERVRTRAMRSEGYHRRPFATATLPNALPPAGRTARRIRRLMQRLTASRPAPGRTWTAKWAKTC